MEWERDFLLEKAGSLDMSSEAFVELYKTNLKERLKQSTWQTKISIIDNKILPYFRKKRMTDIKVSDVVAWQNKLLNMADENGARYSLVYLKTVHNQLSAIFNHAVRFYDLPTNPAAKAGNMGKEKTREMLYWIKDEYIKFSEEIMDKPVSFYAFEMLYWCGLRLGEMLALTPSDFNFEKGIVRINKSYQRIGSVHDYFCRTVVLLQPENLPVRIILLEIEDILYLRPPECIYRLRIVTYHADIAVLLRKFLEYQVLGIVGVLILVHHYIVEPAGQVVQSLAVIPEQDVHVQQDIIEIHYPGLSAFGGIQPVDVKYARLFRCRVVLDDGLVPAVGLCCDQIVLGHGNPRKDILGPVHLVIKLELFQACLDG